MFTGNSASVVINNINAGDKIEWKTAAPHDTVLVDGVAGKFDIGGFGTTQATNAFAPLSGIRYEDDGPTISGAGTELDPITVD
ncbi:MAG: hypothetical protein ACJ8E9_06560, partial [Sphingomicrobium sp.]